MSVSLWSGDLADRVAAALEELARLGVDYELLNNKPSIGGVTLVGNKTLENLGIPTPAVVAEKYVKPGTGIPKTDLSEGLQESIDGAYHKPVTGIPASDLEAGVIPDISGKLDKVAVNNAGISDRTYTTLYEFSVTTATSSGHTVPYAKASVTGRIYKDYDYRVTVNGSVYILPSQLGCEIYPDRSGSKVYEYLGDITKRERDATGVINVRQNVPFLITSDKDSHTSIEVYTTNAGTYNIKIERITVTKVDIPDVLMYGYAWRPFQQKHNTGSTYDAISIGVNELKKTSGTVRGSMAFGFGNETDGEFTLAIGTANKSTGDDSIVIGHYNELTNGSSSRIFGYDNVISGNQQTVIGVGNTSDGLENYIFGSNNENTADTGNNHHNAILGSYNEIHGDVIFASILGAHNIVRGSYSFTSGYASINDQGYSNVFGAYNIADTTGYPLWEAGTEYHVGDKVRRYYNGYICTADNTDSEFNYEHWQHVVHTSDQALIVGNGTYYFGEYRSNAMMLEWDGTLHLAGDVYTSCESDSSGGHKLISVADIASDQDVQDIIDEYEVTAV